MVLLNAEKLKKQIANGALTGLDNTTSERGCELSPKIPIIHSHFPLDFF